MDCQSTTLSVHRHDDVEEPQITCPNCRIKIKLTESLAAPLIEALRHEYEQKLELRGAECARREAVVQEQQLQLERARASIDEEIAARLRVETDRIASEEADKVHAAFESAIQQKETDIADLRQVLEERNAKLAEAQRVQAEALRRQRELDDAKREMDLTIETRVQQALDAVREHAKHEVEGALRLRVAEKEEQISSMQRQIEELKRRAEQGSQQLQGEALELQLEAVLRSKFVGDTIRPVPKGEFGGDVLQWVIGPRAQECGLILWESKRTKNWSELWLSKLREDQRAAKADIAILVTLALPKGLDSFDLVDGVWVADPRSAIPMAIALRHGLVEIATARQAQEGQQSKKDLVYQYLTGPRFRHRIEAIVEKFSDMQEDLERERKAMTRLWAKREEQIRGVIEATVGMYGDLQGIAGSTLKQINGLELPMLESATETPDQSA
jgi:hypothetical protein